MKNLSGEEIKFDTLCCCRWPTSSVSIIIVLWFFFWLFWFLVVGPVNLIGLGFCTVDANGYSLCLANLHRRRHPVVYGSITCSANGVKVLALSLCLCDIWQYPCRVAHHVPLRRSNRPVVAEQSKDESQRRNTQERLQHE